MNDTQMRSGAMRRARAKARRRKTILKIDVCLLLLLLAVGAVSGLSKPDNPPTHMDDDYYLPVEHNQSQPSTPPVTDLLEQDDTPADTDESDWNLILVNPWNKLPDDFSVIRIELSNGHSIDERAYPDLQEMMDDARSAGLSPIICSSFRTMDRQTQLFNSKVDRFMSQGYAKEEAELEAAKWIAVPGTSEHQTGLTLDIVALSYQLLNEEQEKTAEQQWLMENSYQYGFILRYPSDKTDITGIEYEPWHYRYVGKDAAKVIYDESLCLEEYLETLR